MIMLNLQLTTPAFPPRVNTERRVAAATSRMPVAALLTRLAATVKQVRVHWLLAEVTSDENLRWIVISALAKFIIYIYTKLFS